MSRRADDAVAHCVPSNAVPSNVVPLCRRTPRRRTNAAPSNVWIAVPSNERRVVERVDR
jgi:hypothetical protein